MTYNITTDVRLKGYLSLRNPSTCKAGDVHSGGGQLDVKSSQFQLTGTANLRVACDGSGFYSFEIAVEPKAVNFTVSDRTFYLGKSSLTVSRNSTNAATHVAVKGSLSGVANIQASVDFDLPFNNILQYLLLIFFL